jgi:translation initiation factor IF-2
MNLIVKTDVQGSVDAVRTSLEQLSSDNIRIKLIHISTGSINESDVLLAMASQAIIIGFNSRPEQGAQRLANQGGIEIRHYDIIYRLTEDIESGLKGMLDPTIEDVVEGILEIRALFSLGKKRMSAGGYVLEGQVSRTSSGRVKRGDTILYDGPISSLRRFKDDVRQVQSGYECGIALEGFNDYVVGDIIEAHNRQQVK